MSRRAWRLFLGLIIVVGLQSSLANVAIADDVRNEQWHLSLLGITNALSVAQGDGIVVAVVDSGVDASHPDLGGAVVAGTEIYGTGDGRSDSEGHGTAIAGLVSARGRASMAGALGIAPNSLVSPVKTPNQRPLTVAAAIDWARVHGAKIICLALTTSDDRELQMAVRRAQEADIVLVAGAGNFPDVGVQVPAKYPGVVAVVGVDRAGNRADISVSGPEAMLAAPAVDIVSTAPGGGYSKITGTSPATAIVAGVAALVRSKFPELDATEVIHRMTATAIDRGDPGRDKEYGYGIVDPLAALTADLPPNRASLSSSSGPTGEARPTPRPSNAAGQVIGFVVLIIGLIAVIGGVAFLGWRANKRANPTE